MFCRDFKISKASPMFNRAFLVEMFKKNAVCYKEMDYEMFMAVIGKLAVSAFGESMAETQT